MDPSILYPDWSGKVEKKTQKLKHLAPTPDKMKIDRTKKKSSLGISADPFLAVYTGKNKKTGQRTHENDRKMNSL